MIQLNQYKKTYFYPLLFEILLTIIFDYTILSVKSKLKNKESYHLPPYKPEEDVIVEGYDIT